MKATEAQLAEWWCRLNCFEVPEELRGLGYAATGKWEPALHPTEQQKGFLSGTMAVIEAMIGREKCLERWNDPARREAEVSR